MEPTRKKCGAEIDADEVNLGRMIARRRRCNTIERYPRIKDQPVHGELAR